MEHSPWASLKRLRLKPSFFDSPQTAGGLPRHHAVRLNGHRGLPGRCAWLGVTSRACLRPKPITPNLLTLLTLLNPLTLITSSLAHHLHYSSSRITSSFIVASPLYTYCVTLHKDGIDNVEQSGTFPSASNLSSPLWNMCALSTRSATQVTSATALQCTFRPLIPMRLWWQLQVPKTMGGALHQARHLLQAALLQLLVTVTGKCFLRPHLGHRLRLIVVRGCHSSM